jgi:Glutathione-dependent formaldehyde-activating enzyme
MMSGEPMVTLGAPGTADPIFPVGLSCSHGHFGCRPILASWRGLSREILMVEPVLEGGCQCGAIRYRVTGEPLMAAICHCTMCRRANAAPAVAWAMFLESQVAFLSGRPAAYASSPEAKR